MKIHIKLLQGNGEIQIDADEPKEVLEKLKDIKKLMNEMSSLSITEPQELQGDESIQSKLPFAPGDLLAQSNAKNAVDKAMVLIYYLFKQKNIMLVNVNDMKEIFKAVMEAPLRNWGSMLNHLSSKGLLTGGQKKDDIRAWSLTRNGFRYVEEELLTKKPNKGGL